MRLLSNALQGLLQLLLEEAGPPILHPASQLLHKNLGLLSAVHKFEFDLR